MPIRKLVKTKRGAALIAAAMTASAATGWNVFLANHLTPAKPNMTPAMVHEAINSGVTPPAVILAVGLIKKWEGLRTTAYLDAVGKPTLGYGDTLVNGKPVKLGMTCTPAECEDMLIKRVINDYYLPLVDHGKNFVQAPDSVQGAMVTFAYNVGVGDKNHGALGSSSMTSIASYDYPEACQRLLNWNKAGIHGKLQELPGLTARRGIGDAGRAGEGEVCVSGL